MATNFSQKAAGVLADSVLLRRGKKLFAENSHNWSLPLSKFDKLWAGAWLILNDYSNGIFPPTFPDQQKAYQAEKNYRFALPGMTTAEVIHSSAIKPFWFNAHGRKYLLHFNCLTANLEKVGVNPPAKILELGCGTGWASELLAIMGFDVCGTSISEDEIADAKCRIKSIEMKGLSPALKFVAAPMESVHQAVKSELFDAVFVYEALHHAFDWREAIRSAHACLRPNGWLMICNEPNVLHTYVSYRVAKLSNTHEIGFSKRELIAELRKTGFLKIISTGAKPHFWLRPHWLMAQK
jgi:2-polyprenyl-3-methyl-5-hydroxy-6-metoxy-1,4-benzoquinol methylase